MTMCLSAAAADLSIPSVRKIQFEILNAECFACRRQIEKMLKATPGVIGVEISDASPTLGTVVFDPGTVSQDQLLKVLEKQKYKTQNVRPVSTNQSVSRRHSSQLRRLGLPELSKPRNNMP